ncbi:MAG: hypothetical protein QXM52_06950 [Candidatus Bathyarchaeia archaeon]
MYAVWVKIDETLPWIELKGTYETKRDAQKAAKELLGNVMVKVAYVSKERKHMNTLLTVKQ